MLRTRPEKQDAVRNKGFSLIELLVIIVIMGIIITIALPSLGTTLNRDRSTTASDAFLRAVALARSRAIQTGKSTELLIMPASTVSACGNKAVKWAVLVGGAAEGGECVTTTDFENRFPKTTMTTSTGSSTDIIFSPVGIADNEAPANANGSDYIFTVGEYTRRVRIYPGGTSCSPPTGETTSTDCPDKDH